MKYDSLKLPFQYSANFWSARKTNDQQESQPKSIPCHVVKTEKDMLYVMFDTNNNIFTMPTVKMTQGYSRFGREPTQVGDKGYAVPNDYYMGGMDAYAGGKTSFYPRGNLSSLSFQPVANQNAPSRDYNQHHETGGPNGWIVRTMEAQQQSAGPGQSSTDTGGGSGSSSGSGGGNGSSSAAMRNATMRAHQRIMQQRHFMQFSKPIVSPRNGSTGTGSSSGTGNGSSGSGSQQQQSKTQFSFDQNDLATIQSKDTNHLVTVDSQGKKITLQVPTNENVYVGGDGKTGSYAQLVTTKGPVINAQGRYA